MDLTFLSENYLGNPLAKWAICAIILAVALLCNGLFARLASRISYRIFKNFSKARFYEEFSRLFNKPFVQIINLLAVYVAFSQLNFPAEWELAKGNEFGLRWVLHSILVIATIFCITNLFVKATDFMEYVYHNIETSNIGKEHATFLKELMKVVIYIVCVFAILDKAFEVNVTALVASLGIGGLAIALAAQDTLANLIGSFIIYLDKPFQIGELLEIGEIKGTVEKIGFRTTRIRTLDKSLVIVPNKKIVDSNLNNITQSEQRRVKFTLALTYQTKPEVMRKIIQELHLAIKEESPMTDEEITVRFADFEKTALNLLVEYYVNSNDYDVMIEVKERINFKIIDIVYQNNCEFAYPTQTVYVNH